jgi:hypothetical protein
MDEDGKALFKELKDVLKKMPNDPEGLAGWILANFKIKKLSKKQVLEPLLQEKPLLNQEKPTEDKPIVSPNSNKFMKNAGVNTDEIKKIAEKIKKGNVSDDSSLLVDSAVSSEDEETYSDDLEIEEEHNFDPFSNNGLDQIEQKVKNNINKSRAMARTGSVGLISRK